MEPSTRTDPRREAEVAAVLMGMALALLDRSDELLAAARHRHAGGKRARTSDDHGARPWRLRRTLTRRLCPRAAAARSCRVPAVSDRGHEPGAAGSMFVAGRRGAGACRRRASAGCCQEYDPDRYPILIEQLRLARHMAGWSQRTLAERMGIDVQTVKRLEKGVGSVPVLIAAMEALDLRLSGVGPGKTLAEQLRGRRARRSLSLTGCVAGPPVPRYCCRR